jgi:hypothetical protein
MVLIPLMNFLQYVILPYQNIKQIRNKVPVLFLILFEQKIHAYPENVCNAIRERWMVFPCQSKSHPVSTRLTCESDYIHFPDRHEKINTPV